MKKKGLVFVMAGLLSIVGTPTHALDRITIADLDHVECRVTSESPTYPQEYGFELVYHQPSLPAILLRIAHLYQGTAQAYHSSCLSLLSEAKRVQGQLVYDRMALIRDERDLSRALTVVPPKLAALENQLRSTIERLKSVQENQSADEHLRREIQTIIDNLISTLEVTPH